MKIAKADRVLSAESERSVARHLYSRYSTTLSESSLQALLSEAGCYFSEISDSNYTARKALNDFLLKHYPNEIIIKANFIDSVLLKQSQANVSIFELPIGDSRADLCKINGYSSAYEIKTELDSFSRLEKQLQDYFDVFEYVYVITSENQLKSLPDYVPENCGIYSYRQMRNCIHRFKLQRTPIRNRNLDAQKQLEIVSKVAIANKLNSSASHSKECLINECVRRIPPSEINRLFKLYLMTKYKKRWSHFKEANSLIYEIDYQWFFHNNLDPTIVY